MCFDDYDIHKEDYKKSQIKLNEQIRLLESKTEQLNICLTCRKGSTCKNLNSVVVQESASIHAIHL